MAPKLSKNDHPALTTVNHPHLDALFAGLNDSAQIFRAEPTGGGPTPTSATDAATDPPGLENWLRTSGTMPDPGGDLKRVRIREHRARFANVDWPLVYRLRSAVSDKLAKQIEKEAAKAPAARTAGLSAGGGTLSADTVRQIGRPLIRSQVRAHHEEAVLNSDTNNQIPRNGFDLYEQAVDSAMFGYGRWQPLMEDPDFENLEMRNGCDDVFLEYADRVEVGPRVADSDEELIEQLTFLAQYSPTPKPFSPTHPEITLNLEDRYRLHAYAFDVIPSRPSITIRQHKMTSPHLEELSREGLMPKQVADFLSAAVRARQSMTISGDMGVGKTTFLRALAMAMDPMESIGVIESDAELFLHKMPSRKRIINLVAREGSGEGVGSNGRPIGEFSLQQHFIASVRQNLNRIIVGEVRGEEAPAMFQAMQATAGSLSTIHSQHAASTIERLATAGAIGGTFTMADAYRQVAVNINLIIHLGKEDRRSSGGRLTRYVEQITEIAGLKDTTGERFLPAENVLYRHDDHELRVEKISEQMQNALTLVGWQP